MEGIRGMCNGVDTRWCSLEEQQGGAALKMQGGDDSIASCIDQTVRQEDHDECKAHYTSSLVTH